MTHESAFVMALVFLTGCASAMPRSTEAKKCTGAAAVVTAAPVVLQPPRSGLDALAVGEAASQAGDFDRALSEFDWCMKYCLSATPSMVGVWATSLPNDLWQLGSKYPPARRYVDASVARLDSEARKPSLDMSNGDKLELSHSLMMLVALNRVTGQTGRSVELFHAVKLDASTQWTAETLARLIFDELFERGLYADVRAYKRELIDSLDLDVQLNGLSSRNDGELKRFGTSRAARLYLVLLHEQDADREVVADKLFVLSPEPETVAGLVRLCVGAGAWEDAKHLYAKGLSELSAADQVRLKDLIRLPE